MEEEWEWWSGVLHCCRVMWFNLNNEAQNRSLFDRPLLMFLEHLAASSSVLLCIPFYSSNQSPRKNVGNDNYIRFRLDDRGRKSLEEKKQTAEKGKIWKP